MSEKRMFPIPEELFNKCSGEARMSDAIKAASKSNAELPFVMGKQVETNRYEVVDLQKAIHVLIVGNTGSGKSTCLHSIILALLYCDVKMLMIDLKGTELTAYNGIPHLICPVITENREAEWVLDWLRMEILRRSDKLKESGARDINGYNSANSESPMRRMVVLIDGLDQLLSSEIQDVCAELMIKARAVGIHFVCTAQSLQNVKFREKIANAFPARAALQVSTKKESERILDKSGAEALRGEGDMLFKMQGAITHLQGMPVSDWEIKTVSDYLRRIYESDYNADISKSLKTTVKDDYNDDEYDYRLPEAVEIVVEAGLASVSILQRRMRVGYARAGRLIDAMEQRGIVSEADGAMPRSVLITREQMKKLFKGDLNESEPPKISTTIAAPEIEDEWQTDTGTIHRQEAKKSFSDRIFGWIKGR